MWLSITPDSGVIGWRGPPARGAFSVYSTAISVPSGDHEGYAKYPFALVSFLAAPPLAGATYNWSWPGVRASERKAMDRPSGDHAISCSEWLDPARPAVIRTLLAAPDFKLATKMAVFSEGVPSFFFMPCAHATRAPSGEIATPSNLCTKNSGSIT